MADKIEAHMALVSKYAEACSNVATTGAVMAADKAWQAVEASARALAQGDPGEAAFHMATEPTP